MYKELVPSNAGLQLNRTVVVSVRRELTYYVVLHCTWNVCEIENFGAYPSSTMRQFNSPDTMHAIKSSLVPDLRIALTDTTGGQLYKPVDHIKMIVKQLKGFQDFQRNQAGTLTQALANVMRQLCDECGGPGSVLIDRKRDNVFGRQYIRTNREEGKKFQVIWSGGKQTNAILACNSWMLENAREFVEARTSKIPPDVLKKFFHTLQKLACSSNNRLESIEISPLAKQKFVDESWQMDVDTHMLVADLMLIGISKNQDVVKAIAANYRASATKQKSSARNDTSEEKEQAMDVGNS